MSAILSKNGRCIDTATVNLIFAMLCALTYMVRVAHSGKIGGWLIWK